MNLFQWDPWDLKALPVLANKQSEGTTLLMQ